MIMGAVVTMTVRTVHVMRSAVRSMVVIMVLDLYDLNDVEVFILRMMMSVMMMSVVMMMVRALDVHLDNLHLLTAVVRTMVVVPTVGAVLMVGVMPVAVMPMVVVLRLDLNIDLVRRTVVGMLMRPMRSMRMGMSVSTFRGLVEVDLDDNGLRSI